MEWRSPRSPGSRPPSKRGRVRVRGAARVLSPVRKLAEEVSAVRMLTAVLPVSRYIDQGRNPQLYTKECLERALAKNEQVKGKIDTMKVRLVNGE